MIPYDAALRDWGGGVSGLPTGTGRLYSRPDRYGPGARLLQTEQHTVLQLFIPHTPCLGGWVAIGSRGTETATPPTNV